MKRRERSTPIWLFSFVDLAFLLLIAFTQLVPDTVAAPVPIAELELPRIEQIERSAAAPGEPVWQLRVHPLAGSDDPAARRAPFELVEPGAISATADDGGVRAARGVDARDLRARLDLLRARALPRPLLTPHRDARSEDLLVAVALLEQVWQGDRGVAVLPTPAIAADGDSESGERAAR